MERKYYKSGGISRLEDISIELETCQRQPEEKNARRLENSMASIVTIKITSTMGKCAIKCV